MKPNNQIQLKIVVNGKRTFTLKSHETMKPKQSGYLISEVL